MLVSGLLLSVEYWVVVKSVLRLSGCVCVFCAGPYVKRNRTAEAAQIFVIASLLPSSRTNLARVVRKVLIEQWGEVDGAFDRVEAKLVL